MNKIFTNNNKELKFRTPKVQKIATFPGEMRMFN